MRAILGLAMTAVLAASAAAQTSAQSKYERMADTLWSQVNDNYYDPYFRGADWAGARARYAARAHDVHTDAQFQALANTMLAEIPSSHLYVTPPAQTGPAGIGAEFETLNGQTIVHDVAPLSDAAAQGLHAGDRLISDQTALRGELGSAATVTIQRCDGHTAQLRIRREKAFWPPEHPGIRWSRISTRVGHAVGYIRADRFDDGAAPLLDQAMSELGDTQGLIIDIRENSGGNTSGLRLASYFGPGAEPGVILFARPYLQALGHAVTPADVAAAPRINGAYTDAAVFAAVSAHGGGAAFWTDNVDHHYTAPVVVLVSENTGSAAEGFSWYMQTRTHAQFIGRTTAGALLSAESFDLGEGWHVTIPVHGLWGADGADWGDQAVTPQRTVAWTRADLCVGRDPDLASAFAALGR